VRLKNGAGEFTAPPRDFRLYAIINNLWRKIAITDQFVKGAG